MSMKVGNDDNDEDIVADINMTPLIDVMLVLLIIFMVSSTAALESGMDIELPKTALTNEKKEAEILVISLGKDGKVAVQGKAVVPEEITRKIASELKNLKTDSVILEGDTAANLGRAVELMDMAKVAGAKNFSIAAEEGKKN
ncbi:biopolymer transporter ExbD [Bacteriovorax stolpii]|uniref:Biopolymer transporter ExbD n=1 Tax=Bacteriovorax stolpii TaxID=960 RepID=A0A2K9NT40_BACTC|nr:biopolymer transporter ExbD [Bacteriovorax stolpii]AUN98689.1 biopolymer transporter ExbD [Bacteriovorax stolpii]QDK41331.1 biopolymer transporter ExbD [Bacteriovorax stolpii]TDP55802.1 outer membrane transport energization protein ExbD [Bacteriovorax stolpii]BDT28826.1 biopolymer transporter ExbD [Bacteriovorax sp. HI3]